MDSKLKEFDVPILFLVFNRPEKTRKVFTVLQKLKPQKLYVAADAPRKHNTNDNIQCKEVLKIFEEIDWDCDLKMLKHTSNMGCSLAGKKAWDWFFEFEEEMIFLEDDGVPSLSFFFFCKELLIKYRNCNRIGYIGGTNYDFSYSEESYFFSRHGCGTYGMATWKRVYKLYEYKLESYNVQKYSMKFISSFSSFWEFIRRYRQFSRYYKWGGNTYDLQIAYMMYKYNMLWVVPNTNMISNIGFDEQASNFHGNKDDLVAKIYGNRRINDIYDITHPTYIYWNKLLDKRYFLKRYFPYLKKQDALLLIISPKLFKLKNFFLNIVKNK